MILGFSEFCLRLHLPCIIFRVSVKDSNPFPRSLVFLALVFNLSVWA